MPLQSSGPISLNDIHKEVGSASGVTCTINDADIRALIGSNAGSLITFSDFYGASSAADEVPVSYIMRPHFYDVQGTDYIGGPTSGFNIVQWSIGDSYPAKLGYVENGTIDSGPAEFVMNGRMVEVVRLRASGMTESTPITYQFAIRDTTGNDATIQNAGWEAIDIYANQTNDNGSPTYTLPRSAASFNTDQPTQGVDGVDGTGNKGALWTWNIAQALGNVFPEPGMSILFGRQILKENNNPVFFVIR